MEEVFQRNPITFFFFFFCICEQCCIVLCRFVSVNAAVTEVRLMTVGMGKFSAIAFICTGQSRMLLPVIFFFFWPAEKT